jgi:hypothetical protein
MGRRRRERLAQSVTKATAAAATTTSPSSAGRSPGAPAHDDDDDWVHVSEDENDDDEEEGEDDEEGGSRSDGEWHEVAGPTYEALAGGGSRGVTAPPAPATPHHTARRGYGSHCRRRRRRDPASPDAGGVIGRDAREEEEAVASVASCMLGVGGSPHERSLLRAVGRFYLLTPHAHAQSATQTSVGDDEKPVAARLAGIPRRGKEAPEVVVADAARVSLLRVLAEQTRHSEASEASSASRRRLDM